MAVMAATTDEHGIVSGRPYTVDDLEAMPDDGHRRELLDGTLVVSPAPGLDHQTVAYRLYGVLERAASRDLKVVGAPFAVRPSHTTEVQPDLLVARRAELTKTHLPTAPLLAIEVLSSSTAAYDIKLKKYVYQCLGVPSYWVIDPLVPQLMVFELGDTGEYSLVAKVSGVEGFEAERPFPVRVVPADLLDHGAS